MQLPAPRIYSFDDFHLDVPKRQLLRDNEIIQLNPKAFDLLLALVENAGQLLTKSDLFERVWQDQIVEESNLTVNMSAIRRALGERATQPRYITTVSGEGYCFVGNVRDGSVEDTYIVKSHTVGRIVIEHENDEGLMLADKGGTGRKWFVLAGVLMLIVAAAGIGGYLLIRSLSPKTRVSAASASIKKLTTNGKVGYAALSPDGKLFTFAMHEGNASSLWLGYVDGGEPIQIRPPAETIYLSLRFSPDGSNLYYVSSENFRRGELYRIPVLGGSPEKLSDDAKSAVMFSPDGNRLAFVKTDAESQKQILVVTDFQGSNEIRIAEPPANFSFVAATPVWAPDGQTIAIGAASQDGPQTGRIYIVNVASKTLDVLKSEPWRSVNGLTWLRDGSGLVVVARENNALSTQLWKASYPGGETYRIVTDLNLYGGAISLSADDKKLLAVQGQVESNIWVGQSDDLSKAKQITFGSPGQNNGWNGLVWLGIDRLIYTKQINDNITIWSAASDGSGQKQLIPGGGINTLPSVPEDGRSVFFQSDRSGSPAVWRAGIDGGDLVQLTHVDIAAQPKVSPDGKWVIYISETESEGDLWRIPAIGGEALKLTDTRFSWVDISPDSKFIAGGIVENGKAKLGVMSIDGGALLKTFDIPRLANFRLGVRWTSNGQAITYRDWTNGIWKQDVAGGAPVLIKDLPEEKLYGYGWSPDGKRFAYTRGAAVNDVVLLRSEEKY